MIPLKHLTYQRLLWMLSSLLFSGLAIGQPQRVVSLNLCTDLLVSLVAKPEQIAGFSPTSADHSYSTIADVVENYTVHNGSAEEVIRLQPDLIVAPSHMMGVAKLLERLGYKVARVSLPYSLDEINPTVMTFGELLGQPQRAEKVARDFTAAQNAVANTFSGQSSLIIGPNRYTTGRTEFRSDVLAVAGLTSAAPFDGSGSISLEQLIVAAPDILIIDDSTTNQHSLAQSFKRHPALQKMAATQTRRQLTMRSRDWICASPYIANIWQQLEAAQ